MSQHCRRGPWSNTEDACLVRMVETHGPLNWVRIAHSLGSRTPKQCRERYHQNLKPTLNHEPISAEEGELIERLVCEYGKRWADIARRLNGRSDNAVKNWWNGSQNRRRRHDRRRPAHGLSSQASEQSYQHLRRHGQQQHISHQTDGHRYSRTLIDFQPDPFHSVASLSTNRHAQPLPTPLRLPPLASPNAQPHPHYQAHQVSRLWVEAPLPSPCSTEGADSEAGSNYAMSPNRRYNSLSCHMGLPLLPSVPSAEGQLPRTAKCEQHQFLQLPPLTSPPPTSSTALKPSVASSALAQLAPDLPYKAYQYSQGTPHPSLMAELPTAPNSPQGEGREEKRDPRMALTSVLT